MRIDKWLWAARFFKTRALASKACDLGRIHSNEVQAKPARDVHTGDMLHIRNEGGEDVYKRQEQGDGNREQGTDRTLVAAAELDDVAAVALRWAVGGDGRELLHGLALCGEFEARFLAGVGFGVECLSCGGRAAHLAEGEDLDVRCV